MEIAISYKDLAMPETPTFPLRQTPWEDRRHHGRLSEGRDGAGRPLRLLSLRAVTLHTRPYLLVGEAMPDQPD